MYQLIILIASVPLALATFDEDIHSKFEHLPEDEFIEYFNKLNNTWKVQKYDVENLTRRLCKYIGDAKHLPAIVHLGKEESLPTKFDARQKWANCPSIGEIYNQGDCGSCWTFGVATTASDRICIHANKSVALSEQDFQCCKGSYERKVCDGGYPDRAFNCWVQIGLVTQECKPYNIGKLKNGQCTKSCENSADYNADKHFGSKVYRVSDDPVSIKTELSTKGSIEAVFLVYQDFAMYSNGIYTHKFGELSGAHSVRIVGYGEENGVQYWLVANSWGKEWGEQGFFRVQSYQTNLSFESQLLTGIPR